MYMLNIVLSATEWVSDVSCMYSVPRNSISDGWVQPPALEWVGLRRAKFEFCLALVAPEICFTPVSWMLLHVLYLLGVCQVISLVNGETYLTT